MRIGGDGDTGQIHPHPALSEGEGNSQCGFFYWNWEFIYWEIVGIDEVNIC
jgi:hypothetical protein